MLKLKIANKNLLPLLQNGIEEIKTNPNPFDIYIVKVFLEALDNDINNYFEMLHNQRQGLDLDEGYAPQTVLWLFDADTFIGFFVLRHNITERMKQNGLGHIGYEIIPSKRKKGYAKAGLRLLLEYAKNTIGLKEIFIGCLSENIASYKAMIAIMKEFGGTELPDTIPNQKQCVIKLKD